MISLFFITNSNAACDDPLTDGVDYSNCRFSDEQDLQGSYLPNSNLSFTSFIQVNFDKSIMKSGPPIFKAEEIQNLFEFFRYPFTIRNDAITAVGAPSTISSLVKALY